MFNVYIVSGGAPQVLRGGGECVLVLGTVQVYPERPSLEEPASYEEEEGGEQGHLHPVPAVAGARGARKYAGSVLLQHKQTLKG